jgi:hypothetical protein
LVAALAVLPLSACGAVTVQQEQSYRAISSKVERRDFSAWQPEVSASVVDDRASFQANEARQCTLLTTRVGERTTTIRRDNVSPAGTWILGLAGVAGAAALTWGLDQHFDKGRPLTKSGDDGKDTLSGPGYAVYFGGIASLGLIAATNAAIRSVDSSSTEPVEEVTNERQLCERRPLAGALVQVSYQDRVLAEGTTDNAGKLALRCLPEQLELLDAAPEVRVNGVRLEKQILLPPNAANAAAHPAEASASLTAPVNGSSLPPDASERQQLILFSRPLLHGQRDFVVDAVLRAGGKQLERSAHVTSFDVASLAWPNAKTLKLLFNGHGMFVKAHWAGDYSGSKQTELLRAISERFGSPARVARSDGSLLLRWAFADGMEIQYARIVEKKSAGCPLGELSYVDPVAYAAFEAAVNDVAR